MFLGLDCVPIVLTLQAASLLSGSELFVPSLLSHAVNIKLKLVTLGSTETDL